MTGRINLGTLIIRADRRWCMDNAADATPAEHLNEIIRAVEECVGLSASDQLRMELANTRAQLGKLVRAITGSWNPDGSLSGQVTAALGEIRAVEQFLLSLHDESPKIVKHRVSPRETSERDVVMPHQQKGVA